MSLVLKASLLSVGIVVAATLWLAQPSPGVPVSGELAEQLRGGACSCSGAKAADCTAVIICTNNGYICGDEDCDKPDGNPTTYCQKWYNKSWVCNDSSQTYDACGT